MKSVRCLSILLSLILTAGCVPDAAPDKNIDLGPVIEAPAVLDGATVSLTVSDLHGFLDGLGTVASQIAPTMNGPMIKIMLGSRLGDPQFAGVAPSNGIAVVMLSPTNIFAVAEVDPAYSQTYIQSLQAMGLSAEQHDGLLLIATDSSQLAAAGPLAATVQNKLLAAKRDASLRITVRPAVLMSEYEAQVKAGVEQMLVTMRQSAATTGQPVDASKILEAEVQVLLSLAGQIDTVEESLTPVNGSIHLDETVQPLAGSRLAAYCAAPAVNDYNAAVQPGLMEDGAVKLECCIRNSDALVAFFRGEMAALVDRMDVDPAYMEKWMAYMERWIRAAGSTVCESIFTESGFGVSFLEDVPDEAAMMKTLRTMSADLDAMGFLELYKSMGMPMTVEFKENVRTHEGVNIHSLKMDMSMENFPPEQTEAMKTMMANMMNFDVAICNGVLIYTQGEGSVEKIIDQLKSGAEPAGKLAARTALPAGGFCYTDFDIGGYFKFVASFMPETPDASDILKKISAVMAGADPVVSAGYCNSGRMKFSTQIPAGLITRFAQVGQLIAMEGMMKNAARPVDQEEIQPAGPAPKATLKRMDGAPVELSSFAGNKVVVLDFFATWCGPCRKGLPKVQAVADHFADRDVVFYAVNLREDAGTVKGFFAEAGVSLPVVLDDGAVGDAFGVSSIPHTVVIGKDGIIKAVHTGFSPDLVEQLTADINDALAAGK